MRGWIGGVMNVDDVNKRTDGGCFVKGLVVCVCERVAVVCF